MSSVEKVQTRPNRTKMSIEEQLRMSKSQIDQLERENARLVDQLKEVIRMNSHWQRYDAQREEYVLKMTRTNQELQDKMEEFQSQIEALRLESEHHDDEKTPKETGQARATTVQDDLGDLRKEEVVTALTDKVAHLKDRIVELEKKRETSKKDEDDHIAMLREQVNVCVEDFKQERKDRERIHAENLKLRKRLALAEKQVKVYEDKIVQLEIHKPYKRPTSVPHPPPFSPRGGYEEPCCYPEDRPHRYRVPYEENTNRYQHPLYYGDDLTELPRDVEIDGIVNEKQEEDVEENDVLEIPITTSITTSDSLTEKDVEEEDEITASRLQCPRCMASFQHDGDFMKHVDKCIE